MAWQLLLRAGKSKSSGAVKKFFKPNVGSLTKTRAVQDDLVKSIDKGKKIKGKEEVKKILMKQPPGKKLHDIIKKTGDVHQRNVSSEKQFRQAAGKK
tara:strand:- start:229 stop:519 length:291 start_codon:yes stop_codon:yes gene_type:complete